MIGSCMASPTWPPATSSVSRGSLTEDRERSTPRSRPLSDRTDSPLGLASSTWYPPARSTSNGPVASSCCSRSKTTITTRCICLSVARERNVVKDTYTTIPAICSVHIPHVSEEPRLDKRGRSAFGGQLDCDSGTHWRGLVHTRPKCLLETGTQFRNVQVPQPICRMVPITGVDSVGSSRIRKERRRCARGRHRRGRGGTPGRPGGTRRRCHHHHPWRRRARD